MNAIVLIQDTNEVGNGVTKLGEDQHLPIWFPAQFVGHQAFNLGEFGMEFFSALEGKTEVMDGLKSQQTVGVSSVPPLLFSTIEKRLDDFCSLRFDQVDHHVEATQVPNSASSIITPDVALLNGLAGSKLGTFNIARRDVFLGGEEPKTLKVGHFVAEVLLHGSSKGGKNFGRWQPMLMNDHVHIVRFQKGLGSLGKIHAQGSQIVLHLLDVFQIGTWAGRGTQNPTIRSLLPIQPSDLCVGVIAGCVMRFIDDEQRNFTQVNDLVHRIVTNDLRCGHEHATLVP